MQEGLVLSRKTVSVLGQTRWCLLNFYRYSVLPALSLDGIVALDIIQGSYDAKHFKKSIDGLLDQMNVFPGPRSVIIMDNCAIHKSKSMMDMIYER